VRQDVAPIGDLQRQVHVLLHQQHAGSVAGGGGPDRREQPVYDNRGQAQAHLVEHQQLRPAAERPRDRQHLLLAAGQQPGLASAQLAECREVTERGVHLGLATQAVQPEVLGDRQAEEDPAVVRDVRETTPCPRGRGHPREVGAVQPDRAAGRLQQSRYRPQRGGLAGAVGTEERDDLAAADGQRQVAHDRRTVIGHGQLVELKDGIAPRGRHLPTHLRRPPSGHPYRHAATSFHHRGLPSIGVHANLPTAIMCPPHT
jgi:hypothetical protein